MDELLRRGAARPATAAPPCRCWFPQPPRGHRHGIGEVRHRAAAALLNGADGWSDEATTRSRVHCQLRAATALIHAEETEQAIAVANQALPALPGLRSHRVLDDAKTLRHATAPYRRRPDIANLACDLTTAQSP